MTTSIAESMTTHYQFGWALLLQDAETDPGSSITTAPSAKQPLIKDKYVSEPILGRGEKKVKSVEVKTSDQWESAGVPLLFAYDKPRIAGRPEIDQSVAYMYTDRVKDTLNRLLLLLERTARRNYVQVSRVQVGGFVDPEDESDEVVVTQWINAPAYIALPYWDKLGLAIETWIKSLPDELARIANERIAVEVQWR